MNIRCQTAKIMLCCLVILQAFTGNPVVAQTDRSARHYQLALGDGSVKKMYMRTRHLLLKAGNLCKLHQKRQMLFAQAILHQRTARSIFLGHIWRDNRNQMTAAITMKARQLARQVIIANYGRLNRQERDKPLELVATSGIDRLQVAQEVSRTANQAALTIPPLNVLFEDRYFYLGDEKSLRREFRRFHR